MKARWVAVWFLMIFVLTACVHTLPAASPDLLQQKPSVLMVTASGLSSQAEDIVGTVLQTWNQQQMIAYDWLRKIQTMENDQVQADIKNKSYDYIFVVGNELLPQAAEISAKYPESRWVFMQDGPGSAEWAASANAMTWTLDTALIKPVWDQWVREQTSQGVSLEWITRQDRPIPLEWAPSEEEDHILPVDLYGNQWYPQLIFQISRNKPKWLIVYANLDENQYKRIRGLNIPIVDMASSRAVSVRWDLVWPQQLAMIKKGAWEKGTHSYLREQMQISFPAS